LLEEARSVDTGRMEGLFVALGIAAGAMIVAVAYLVIK
jgi:threonine/homoserine/homoserine lactone efflux protein